MNYFVILLREEILHLIRGNSASSLTTMRRRPGLMHETASLCDPTNFALNEACQARKTLFFLPRTCLFQRAPCGALKISKKKIPTVPLVLHSFRVTIAVKPLCKCRVRFVLWATNLFFTHRRFKVARWSRKKGDLYCGDKRAGFDRSGAS